MFLHVLPTDGQPVRREQGRRQQEVDVFVGNEGADIFIFGDFNGSYYDDGIGASSGESDFGFVWDFVTGVDKIQLAGSAADYQLTEDPANLPSGTAIWRVGTNGDADELIGVLNTSDSLDLGGDSFIFTDSLFT